ncbi:hypothetical protein H9657_05610 [Cellulomonas sp. Sa3CUA2]|uniref:CTP synthase n=1 Tax=Cellulomonas avistercoris TaxID=2762242 RepID=A0ABR8QBF8_9CELL|nr:hypothetical protein [Cellulomonas avistercoris]MBD7917756.1 hypothetical protein [Cellulomonas avistercoris]
MVHVAPTARGAAADAEQLQRALREGRLVRVRRGSYVAAGVWRDLDDGARHVALVRAVLAAASAPPVFSHGSAAAVLGLPTVGHRDDAVHVVRGPADGGRSHGDVVRHAVAGHVPVAEVDGIVVTNAARTVVDLARTAGLVPGVVAGDAAVRCGLTSLAELRVEVARAGGGRGVRAARRVVELVDPASESPGESVSRVRMAELGLPVPVLQHEVRDRQGLVGRVDFWWAEQGVVGEFDGRVKYGTGDPEVLWAEKLREDRLRATGLRVARWTWSDAWAGDPMAARLRAAGLR